MEAPLRQSTDSQEDVLGPFLDSTDANTPETGLTILNTDIKLNKSGTTTLVSKNSGGGTHVSGGNYSVVWDSTDTNTPGKLEATIHVAGALYVKKMYIVYPANVYDSLFSTDKLQVDTTLIEGEDATDQLEAACDSTPEGESPATTEEDWTLLATWEAALNTVQDKIANLSGQPSIKDGSLVIDYGKTSAALRKRERQIKLEIMQRRPTGFVAHIPRAGLDEE